MLHRVFPVIFYLIPALVNGIDSPEINQEIFLDEVLKKAKYNSGLIFLTNDSIEAEILIFRGKHKRKAYEYCIGKYNNDSIELYSADEILGYKIGEDIYIKHSSNGKHFFIHQIKSGIVDLYERSPIPSDINFLYYLKFPKRDILYIINPNEENITDLHLSDKNKSKKSNALGTIYTSKNIPEKFKLFVRTHFSDCEGVVNMVNAEFYTIKNIPSIVETYNKCFE